MSRLYSGSRPYLASLAAIALTAVAAAALGRWLGVSDMALVFLVPVLWSAVRFGRLPSVFTAVVGAAAGNFFFFAPAFAFGFARPEDAITLAVFLLTALTTSGLVAEARDQGERHREQAELARRRAAEVSALYAISREIASASDAADVKRRVERAVSEVMGVEVRLLTEDDEAAGQEARLAVPVMSGTEKLGVLAMIGPAEAADAGRRRMLEAVANQVALALQRARLAEEMVEARLLADGERLRSLLLSSVSHDFRTPLGTIIGAASGLLSDEAAYSEQARRGMLSGILQSARRLDRYVRNLLDIVSIESGAVSPKRDWVDLADVVAASLDAVEGMTAGHRLRVDIPPGLPPLRLDFVLIERVFVNLLENAAKFSPPGSTIAISAWSEPGRVVAEVFNGGVEIPAEHLERLFDKFYRGRAAVAGEGSGLGLTICRGFLAAHGAGIEARRDDARGGVAFVMSFPASAAPSPLEAGDE